MRLAFLLSVVQNSFCITDDLLFQVLKISVPGVLYSSMRVWLCPSNLYHRGYFLKVDDEEKWLVRDILNAQIDMCIRSVMPGEPRSIMM